MIERFAPDELLEAIRRLPEQWKQDCKSTLRVDNNYLKAELVKDIVAIANSPGDDAGNLFFGVDLKLQNPIVGLSQSFDDASLQQIVASKLETPVSFLYYEVLVGEVTVGVVSIPPSRRRPHIIRVDYEHLREGMIPIRRGSSTTWANQDDLREMFNDRAVDPLQELRDLIRSIGDESLRTSSLALQAWDLCQRLGADETSDWLRGEITGFAEEDMAEQDIPDYRECKAFVTKGQLNPYALWRGDLQTLAAMHPNDFQETTVRFGHSLSQLEEMIARGNRQKGGVLYRRKVLPTEGGGEAEAWFYFEPNSIAWILRRVRDQICSSLIQLQAMPKNS